MWFSDLIFVIAGWVFDLTLIIISWIWAVTGVLMAVFTSSWVACLIVLCLLAVWLVVCCRLRQGCSRRVHSSDIHWTILAIVLWCLYLVYEHVIGAFDDECNIRLDLLVILPVLLAAGIYPSIRILLLFFSRYRTNRGHAHGRCTIKNSIHRKSSD